MKLQLQSQTETTQPETQKFLPTAITNHHRHYQASTEVLPARSWPFISRMVKASTAKTLASSSSGDVRQGSFWKPGARTSHSQCSQSWVVAHYPLGIWHSYWTWPFRVDLLWFTYQKWWFSIVVLVYQRVHWSTGRLFSDWQHGLHEQHVFFPLNMLSMPMLANFICRHTADTVDVTMWFPYYVAGAVLKQRGALVSLGYQSGVPPTSSDLSFFSY